jgi:putative flippase GtrA
MTDIKVQLGRFAGVGLAATLVHLAAAFAAHQAFDIGPLASNTFGFTCATGLTYVGNYYWTFASHAGHAQSLGRYATLAAVSFVTSSAIVAGTAALGWPFVATLAAIAAVVPPVNFLASKLWVFRERSAKRGQSWPPKVP